MKFEHEAFFLEQFIEHIRMRYSHFLTDGNSREALASDFVDWVVNVDFADIYHKRGRDNVSYNDLRNDEVFSD